MAPLEKGSVAERTPHSCKAGVNGGMYTVCIICQIVKINPFPMRFMTCRRCCGGPCADASESSWEPCLWHAAFRCSWEGGLEGGEIQLLVGWPWVHLKMHGFPSLTWPLKFESTQRCIDGKSLVPAWVTSFGICLLAGWGSRRLVTTGIPRAVGLSVREWCHQWLQLLVCCLCNTVHGAYVYIPWCETYGQVWSDLFSKLYLRGYHGQHVHHSHKHKVFCRGPVFVFWIFCGLDLMRLCSRC